MKKHIVFVGWFGTAVSIMQGIAWYLYSHGEHVSSLLGGSFDEIVKIVLLVLFIWFIGSALIMMQLQIAEDEMNKPYIPELDSYVPRKDSLELAQEKLMHLLTKYRILMVAILLVPSSYFMVFAITIIYYFFSRVIRKKKSQSTSNY